MNALASQIIKQLKADGYTDAEDAGEELTIAIEDAVDTAEEFDALEAIIFNRF
jgi:hypothetical protein